KNTYLECNLSKVKKLRLIHPYKPVVNKKSQADGLGILIYVVICKLDCKCFCTPNNFQDFGSNSCLSCFVVLQYQIVANFFCVIGCFVHRGHTSTMLTSYRIPKCFIKLCF